MAARFPFPLGPGVIRALATLRAARPAVVITNTRFQPITWLGAAFARRSGIPLLHIEHGSGHVPMDGRIAAWLSRALDRTAGRWVVARAAASAGVSPASASFLESLGAMRPRVLPSGIDLLDRSEPARREWRARLGLREDDVAVLYLGRVTDDKGVPLLVQSFRALDPASRAHLVVAGDGAALGRIRAESAGLGWLHVLGQVDPSSVPGLLAASDAFAHPSMCAEGGPRTVLEAAAAGLAIVATPQGITPEVVRSEAEGILVPPGDAPALTQALQRLVSDPALRATLGAAVRRNVTERFDWDRVALEAERLVSSLIPT